MPPARNTNIRWRLSLPLPPAEGFAPGFVHTALCRNEVTGAAGPVAAIGLDGAARTGSTTYGNVP